MAMLQATDWDNEKYSIAERRRIVSELDVLQAEVEALNHPQAETAAESAALLTAILDKAFTGEV